MGAIFKRELRAYFSTPSGYVFLGLFLLLAGIFFGFGNIIGANSNYNSFLNSIQFTFIFVVPVLTMRLMAEETKQKTDQLLFTSPVKIVEIMLGKYFAAFTLFAVAVSVCFLYSLIIVFFGDFRALESLSSGIGFLLLGAAFISVGTFISCTTDNQTIAAVATFAVLLVFWLLEPIRSGLPQDITAGVIFAGALVVIVTYAVYSATKSMLTSGIVVFVLGAALAVSAILRPSIYYGFIASALEWFSLLKRQQSFTMGLIRLDSVVYYLSFISAFLFLSVRFIEKRRWM